MVLLCDHDICTGCGACFNACLVGCITMQMGDDGFLYPSIDNEKCIECGFCLKSCPIYFLNRPINELIPKVFVGWNKDQSIRKISSSGGIFLPLAQSIINKGGVVFGAEFNQNHKVVHSAATTIKKSLDFLGSKYVQSDIGDCYIKVQRNLDQGMPVLFSGAPCQVAGLYSFLKKDYTNLVTCDFVCHGVPSPGVFSEYLLSLEKKYKSKIISVNFRAKRHDTTYDILIKFASGSEYWRAARDDEYYRSFLSNMILRKSCYKCNFTTIPRQADVTLGDFHGIEKIDAKYSGDKQKGVSVILCNNAKGERVINGVVEQLYVERRTLYEASKYNRLQFYAYREPEKRKYFFKQYSKFGYDKARNVLKLSLRNKIGMFLGPEIVKKIKIVTHRISP